MCACFPALKPLLSMAFPMFTGSLKSSGYGSRSRRKQVSESYQLSSTAGKGGSKIVTTNCVGLYGPSTTGRCKNADESSTEDLWKKDEDAALSTVEVESIVTSNIAAPKGISAAVLGGNHRVNRIGSTDNANIVKTTEISVVCDTDGQWVGETSKSPPHVNPLPVPRKKDCDERM